MSAIEVLKNYWKYVHSKNTIDVDSEFHNALDEALLALEKQEKLKGWLEKEIAEYNDAIEKEVGSEDNRLHNILTRKVLEEVLERVGEQK
jgi:hypothetical protein